ncbi:MAG: L-idonate 5-dehydrogenase [Desulfobacterales bacterium]|nr:L-idonate 5-dehydrogenase [Desulfofustis sp.]NNF47902.1 L-idonate 5-dehydrogenase [Desulfofustis sp.]NNK95956.1 L-idonate 5-dehydrogenase [Desulfobacterales bacterium]
MEDRSLPELGDLDVRIAIKAAGICGSDLHYHQHGKVAAFSLKEPLVLGHEACGEIVEVGKKSTLTPGDRVVINPGLVCGNCKYCLRGQENLCRDIKFMGSASYFPHIQGTFQETVVVREQQCHVVRNDTAYQVLAFAEPLTVALHAVRRAGNFFNQRVLIIGSGTIGLLVASLARLSGAAYVAITDILDYPLQVAHKLGVDECINAQHDNEVIASWQQEPNSFPIVIEATGTYKGFEVALSSSSPGGKVVEVGILPDGQSEIPFSHAFAKELDVLFVLRQNLQFSPAVDMLEKGKLDPLPLLSASFALNDFEQAFALARDKSKAIKVQLEP